MMSLKCYKIQTNSIITEIETEGVHRSTRVEWNTFSQHIQQIEARILEGVDVIICTVATLADSRAEQLQSRQERRQGVWGQHIQTCVMDESGQVSQPGLTIVPFLKPRRVIVVGDHKQLQPNIESTSAEYAGLGKSELEWASSAIDSKR